MNSPTTCEIDAEPRTCEQHGRYMAKVLRMPFAASPVYSECPKCAEARRRENEAYEKAQRDRQDAQWRADRLAQCGIPPRFAGKTIDQFDPPCDAAKKVKAVAERFVAGFNGARGTSLVFCGKPGTGKTHLACAIAADITKQTSARFTSVLAAIRYIKGSYRSGCGYTESDAIDGFVSPSLLVLDEVGVQVGSEHEKMLLFEIINERYQRMRSTILISNLTHDELRAYLGDRLIDRFREDGAVVAFDWPSHRGLRP